MTRERAIEVLKAWDLNWSDNFTANEFEQAFAMAISALSENKGDLISRQAVIDALTKTSGIRGDALKALYDLPSTENKGEWEWVQYDYNPKFGDWRCSECRSVVIECTDKKAKDDIPLYKYCPQCGAKMKGGE